MSRKRSDPTQGIQRRNVAAATRVITALDLAIAGHDWQTIADRAGYGNRGTAYAAVQRELQRRIDQRVDTLRTLQLARLGRLRTVYYPKAMSGDGWSMDRTLRLDERESALMGLDAVRESQQAAPTILEIPDTLIAAIRGQLPNEQLNEQAQVVQAIQAMQEGAGSGDSDRE